MEIPLPPSQPPRADKPDALLLPGGILAAVNGVIHKRSQRKLALLESMKQFKSGIYSVWWDTARLARVAEDVVEDTRRLHLLRLTKPLQQVSSYWVAWWRRWGQGLGRVGSGWVGGLLKGALMGVQSCTYIHHSSTCA